MNLEEIMTTVKVLLTVLSGVVVYVAGQIFVKFVLEPIHEFYKLTGEIGHALIYYANVYTNTGLAERETLEEAHRLFRRQSCDLFARTYAIPIYSLWTKLRLIPPRKEVLEAGSDLIGLSNGVLDTSNRSIESNSKRRSRVERLLRIQTQEAS